MPIDKAPKSYSDWLAAQVTDVEWRKSYLAAGALAVEQGYELQWFCNNKADGVDKLEKKGIKPGIPRQFVDRISTWVDKVNTSA